VLLSVLSLRNSDSDAVILRLRVASAQEILFPYFTPSKISQTSKSNVLMKRKFEQAYCERFEVFTALALKNAVYWVVTPRGSCEIRCFEGTCRLHHQAENKSAS
jgi:hypothetical protein